MGRAENLHIDSDISDLKRQLQYEEDSQIWKGVKPQFYFDKILVEKFGPPKRNQTKILSTIDTFEHQTDRLRTHYYYFFTRSIAYFSAVLGTLVLLL